MNYTLTPESVTVIVNGTERTFLQGTVQYTTIAEAILNNRKGDIAALCEPHGALTKQLYGTNFLVSQDGKVTYLGNPVPESIVERMNALVAAGESVQPLARFFERLDRNPSFRSRTQLFDFIKHLDIKIESGGTFLAYKAVRDDLLDKHSGTIRNVPGEVVTMPRNQISDDPAMHCHYGLHVGAKYYATQWFYSDGDRVVIVRVDPEHVVCVPNDHSGQKMRVCQYEVVGEFAGHDLTPDQADEVEPDPTEILPWEDELGDGFVSVPQATHPLDELTKTLDLMRRPIEELRQYAGKILRIVGASKIPGGKSALVAKIQSARRRAR